MRKKTKKTTGATGLPLPPHYLYTQTHTQTHIPVHTTTYTHARTHTRRQRVHSDTPTTIDVPRGGGRVGVRECCACVRTRGTCCGRLRRRANGVPAGPRRRGRRCSERLVCQWTIVQTGTQARILVVPNHRAGRTTFVTHHR